MDLKFVDSNLVPYVPSRYLSFDDIQILPQHSTITSRKDPKMSVSTRLSPMIMMPVPIISSPMDCVTEGAMAVAMVRAGGFGLLHRFYERKYKQDGYDRWLADVQLMIKECQTVGMAISSNPQDIDLVNVALEHGSKGVVVCVDLAHGHSTLALEQINRLRKRYGSNVQIMSGSICTPGAAFESIQAGADILRVGVGCGSVCTTRLQTGIGVPQLTAIMQIRRSLYGMKKNATLVADGGIRNSGDIAKALAAGADSVMLGRLLAPSKESSAITSHLNAGVLYRGQASAEFMSEMGIDRSSNEGESMIINTSGRRPPVFDIVNELVGGLKSSMSYCGTFNLEDFTNNTYFVEVTPAGQIEATAHGKRA